MKTKTTNRFHKTRLLSLLLLPLILLVPQLGQAFLTKDIILGGRGHSAITEDGIKNLTSSLSDGSSLEFTIDAIDEIVVENKNVDKNALTVNDPKYHFDNETFVESSKLLKSLKEEAILEVLKDAAKTENEGVEARKALGKALHILQDYYTHSNWVERGKTEINLKLGSTRPLDSGGSNPPDAGVDVCILIPPANIFPLDGDELTADGKIFSTTGYVAGDDGSLSTVLNVCARPTTAGKCRHGVPGVCPGLAKDIPFASSGYSNAANLAVEATKQYVQSILDDERVKNNDNALRVLLGHEPPPKVFEFEFNLVRADGALITPELIFPNYGMAVFISAPNGDFSFAQTQEGLIDDTAPSDMTYNPGSQTWTLTVPEVAEVFGDLETITSEEFWITFINVADSLDTQYPGLVRESQLEQTAHLITPGNYSMTLPVFSDGDSNNLPQISGDSRSVSIARSNIRSSVPFEVTYKITFAQRQLGESRQQQVNNETIAVSDDGTVFTPFVFEGRFEDILRAETTLVKSPHINNRSYRLDWNIVSGSKVFELRNSGTQVYLPAISSRSAIVSVRANAILD